MHKYALQSNANRGNQNGEVTELGSRGRTQRGESNAVDIVAVICVHRCRDMPGFVGRMFQL